MIVIKLREHLLHYGLPEKSRLGTYPELVTILPYGSHLTVIQIDDLSVATHQRLLLLLQVFRIDSRLILLLFSHFRNGLLANCGVKTNFRQS